MVEACLVKLPSSEMSLDFADDMSILIQGPVSIRKTVLPGMGIPMLKIRRPVGRLIFNMGIAIPSKTVFLIETAPRCWIGAIRQQTYT